jgi:hypothetical protein
MESAKSACLRVSEHVVRQLRTLPDNVNNDGGFSPEKCRQLAGAVALRWLPFMEQPEQVVRIVLEFIASLGR